MKKRIVSILAAGLAALSFVSCVREQMTVFDATKATAPVLNSYDVTEDGVSASFTPGAFNQSFNQKMPVNHSLVIVSVGGNPVTRTVSASVSDGLANATAVNMSKALVALGCQEGDVVDFDMVVRASMQEVSKDNGRNGYVDSEGRIQVRSFLVTVPVPQGNPWKEFTEPSPWSMIGAIASTGNSWNADGPMYMTADGTQHVAMKVLLTPADQFKVRKDAGWDVNFGAPGDTEPYVMEVGTAIEATANGKNLGVAAEGYYDLLLDTEAGTLTLFEAFETYPGYDEISTWSVIGAIASVPMEWNKDIQMTTDGEWHVAEGVVLTKDDQFKFRKDLGWDTNIGAAGDTEPFVVELDTEYDGVANGKNLAVPADGTYDLLVNPDAGLYKVVESLGGKSPLVGGDTPEPPAPAATGWNIIGLNGDWDNDVLATQNGSKWTVYATVADATEFKWRKDGAWDENFGGTFVTAGEPFEAVSGGSNISIGPGFWEIVLDTEALTITISEGNVYSLIGEINGDAWTKDVFMTEKDGIWTSVTVAIEGGFKIRHNCSWADADVYGAEEGFTAEPGVAFTAVQPGGNISVAPGNYKVTFDPATKQVLIGESKYPEQLYMIGEEFGGWNWDSDGVVEMTPVLHNPDWGAEAEGQFYTVRYISAGKGFKFCAQRAWSGDFWGLTYNDGFTEAGGNCTVSEDGFYLVHIDFKNEKVHVEPARIYGIGEAFGGWDEEKEENLFKADGKTLKATLPKAGNLRMYAASSISTSGWWTREFNLFDGQIVPRLMDELAAVPAKAGQVVVLDFNAGTGEITGEGEAPAYKTEISVPGAYSGSEWSLDTAPKLLGKADGIFKGALAMYKKDGADIEFKFGHDGSWIGGTADGLNYTLGSDGNMTIDEGSYFWTVDLENKTAAAVKIEKVGLIGSFNSWSDDVVLTFNSSDYTYSGQVTLEANAELKVRFNGSWDYSLGGDLNRLQDVNDNCKVAEAGTYSAKLDLNKGTLTLTK
ncbi:MAG: SusF/SusE family outer membrane protein [Bacteroidales bacterium]|nr:SusF/SusE family outer membrane protein [Bacteroidales bacterium]